MGTRRAHSPAPPHQGAGQIQLDRVSSYSILPRSLSAGLKARSWEPSGTVRAHALHVFDAMIAAGRYSDDALIAIAYAADEAAEY